MTSERYIEILFKQVFQRDVPKDSIPFWTRYSQMELAEAFIRAYQDRYARFGKVKLPPRKPKSLVEG